MVSNFQRARVWLSILLLFLSWTYLSAQEISKHYTARHQENGILYFFHKQDGFKNSASWLVYDMTYLTNSDSITLNFTVNTKDDLKIDSIVLINDERITSNATKLFVESKRDKWIYRYSAKFLFKDLEKFFVAGTPTILIHSNNKPVQLSINKGKWKEQFSIMKKIFNLINHNR